MAYTTKPTPANILVKIKSGELDPLTLPKEDRRDLVEGLTDTGYTAPQIAEVLRVHPNTVHNDRNYIRHRYRIHARIKDPDTYVGSIIRETEGRKAQLRLELSNKKDVMTCSEYATYIKTCHQIDMELLDRLIKIGKIPSAVTKVKIDSEVKHSGSVNLSREELERNIKENREILEKAGWFRTTD